MNYIAEIELTSIKGAKRANLSLNGQAPVECVVIPVVEGKLRKIFHSGGERTDANLKSIVVDAWVNERQDSKYGDSHSLRQRVFGDIKAGMTDDEIKALPFMGKMREANYAKGGVATATAEVY